MSDVTREEFEALQKKVSSMETGSVKKPKRTREPTAYNKFVGRVSKELREKTPSLAPKEAFTKAVEQWKTSDENPSNKK
jgi:hypothetical protein